MPEWSFQRKLITGVAVICMLVILTSVASLLTSRALVGSMMSATAGDALLVTDVRALELEGVRQVAASRTCLLTRTEDARTEASNGSLRLQKEIARLDSVMPDSAGRALLDAVARAEHEHRDMFSSALASEVPGRAPAPAGMEALRVRGAELERSLAALVTRIETERMRSLAPTQRTIERTETVLVAISVATILLLMLLCGFLIAALNRSYRRQTVARALAEVGQTKARATLSEVEAIGHLKDEFLATVSHELRNPLAPILTWTQLLRSGTLDPEKTSRALEVIERNVNSQAKLIDDLVDVSRVVSGKFRLDVRPIDLLPVIKAAAEAQIPASEAKQIRLQLVLDSRAGLISGDSERLQQVMANLMSNAIKFTRKGGRVTVVLQRAESHVEVSVTDNGIGIDAEFLPHVFEPFRQGTAGSMRQHGGLGLGLSIVRHIVELHGGDITAASEGTDRGARFTLTFPLLTMAREAPGGVRSHPIAGDKLADVQLGRLDGLRVLVVDDEPSASEALLALFGACGAVARSAGSAPEAFGMLQQWRPDVLVSDIAMPGEDGYELIRKVRRLGPERGGKTPAVALTAYAKTEDRVTILSAGFQMYLSKPANPNELVAVVASLARRREHGEVEPRT